MISERIIDVLLAEARRQKLTPQRLADEGEIAYAAAHRLLAGEARRPTLESVCALVSVLGLRIEIRTNAMNRRIYP